MFGFFLSLWPRARERFALHKNGLSSKFIVIIQGLWQAGNSENISS